MPIDLTTLADVQAYMSDTSAETAALINAIGPGICRAMETYCDRVFVLTEYSGKVWSIGGRTLYLPNYPVRELRRLMRYSKAVLDVQNTSADASSATVQVSQKHDRMYLNVIGGANAGNNGVQLSGSDLDALAILINAVGDGWVATVRSDCGDYPATELTPFAGASALTPYEACCYLWYGPLTKLDLEPERGRVEFKNGAFPQEAFLWAEYSAGYDPIPDDLALLATRIIAGAVKASKLDPNMQSERWPDYNYAKAELIGFCTKADMIELDTWRKVTL